MVLISLLLKPIWNVGEVIEGVLREVLRVMVGVCMEEVKLPVVPVRAPLKVGAPALKVPIPLTFLLLKPIVVPLVVIEGVLREVLNVPVVPVTAATLVKFLALTLMSVPVELNTGVVTDEEKVASVPPTVPALVMFLLLKLIPVPAVVIEGVLRLVVRLAVVALKAPVVVRLLTPAMLPRSSKLTRESLMAPAVPLKRAILLLIEGL